MNKPLRFITTPPPLQFFHYTAPLVARQARAVGKSAAAPKAAAPSQSSAAAAAASQVVVQEIPDKEGFLGAFELFRKAKAPKKVFQVGGCVGGWGGGTARWFVLALVGCGGMERGRFVLLLLLLLLLPPLPPLQSVCSF